MQKIETNLKADVEEELPLVDKNGNLIGKALRSECHKNRNLIHPVVHVHILNKQGQLYLQKRSKNKIIQPNKWDTSVGGHITYGEPIETALKREAWEEAGVVDGKFEKIDEYLWECNVETEYINVYKCIYENPKIIAKNEIDEGKFWNFDDIENNIGKNIFTPNFEHEFIKIKSKLKTIK